eukprot:CAMPEP_0172640028 /NCGR_PEP_ID=MMETSP1068-20121228/221149_1 /TAXON_ID=35684 /ORGANISM="Pseudopedinella elastica, Strain CCMP716" /LENGTH=56 /DNA_ID=CAMNT_0013453309 /DNA_START=48 /DNA_END=215 /DNA_ORIENTATION=+
MNCTVRAAACPVSPAGDLEVRGTRTSTSSGFRPVRSRPPARSRKSSSAADNPANPA